MFRFFKKSRQLIPLNGHFDLLTFNLTEEVQTFLNNEKRY